jgi:hypothetical protein
VPSSDTEVQALVKLELELAAAAVCVNQGSLRLSPCRHRIAIGKDEVLFMGVKFHVYRLPDHALLKVAVT